jgi:hypothetical protein|nr:hypothetical protein [uncultured Nitrososphaera sp.]
MGKRGRSIQEKAYGDSTKFLPEIDAHFDQLALISRILPRQYVDETAKASHGCLTGKNR